MDFNEYQNFAISTAVPCAKDPLYLVCGLCEEVGEVAGKIKKTIRDNNGEFDEQRRHVVALELSDVLWYMSNLAHQLGYSMSEIASFNVDKINGRLERGSLHRDGDNR